MYIVPVDYSDHSLDYLRKSYTEINNFMLRMRGHVSAGVFAVTSYSCKVNAMVFLMLLQLRKVDF